MKTVTYTQSNEKPFSKYIERGFIFMVFLKFFVCSTTILTQNISYKRRGDVAL